MVSKTVVSERDALESEVIAVADRINRSASLTQADRQRGLETVWHLRDELATLEFEQVTE
jgi:hypothetical protein